MRSSRGMGGIMKSKMPKGKKLTRKDDSEVSAFAEGGWVKDVTKKPWAKTPNK